MLGYNTRMQTHNEVKDNIAYIVVSPDSAVTDGPDHQFHDHFQYSEKIQAFKFFLEVTRVRPGHSVWLRETGEKPTVLFDKLRVGEEVILYLYSDGLTQGELERAFVEFLAGQQNAYLRAQMREDRTGVVVISRRIERE